MHFSTLLGAAGFAALTAAAPAELATRSALSCSNLVTGLLSADCKILANLGLTSQGGKTGGTVVGGKNPNVWTVTNKSSKDIIVVTWGPNASWVNANQPDVTYSLAAGKSVTLTTPNGYSGAMSAIYGSDTKLVNGQVSNTWLEFTTGDYGVINVSREVNTKGNTVSGTITSSSGQKCTTDFSKCVFTCGGDATSCWQPLTSANPTGYHLLNCAAGSQPGAQSGSFDGGDSGGCGGFSSSGAKVSVTFS